ncbi:MAG: hypothetical protein AAGM38_00340 [Pseudomonadota bacterium]
MIDRLARIAIVAALSHLGGMSFVAAAEEGPDPFQRDDHNGHWEIPDTALAQAGAARGAVVTSPRGARMTLEGVEVILFRDRVYPLLAIRASHDRAFGAAGRETAKHHDLEIDGRALCAALSGALTSLLAAYYPEIEETIIGVLMFDQTPESAPHRRRYGLAYRIAGADCEPARPEDSAKSVTMVVKGEAAEVQLHGGARFAMLRVSDFLLMSKGVRARTYSVEAQQPKSEKDAEHAKALCEYFSYRRRHMTPDMPIMIRFVTKRTRSALMTQEDSDVFLFEAPHEDCVTNASDPPARQP